MKKTIILILIPALLAALAVSAFADVIWEPGDNFYFRHRDECVYMKDARYEAQADADVLTSPEDPTVVGSVSAGDILFIGYIWQGDALWGAVFPFRGEDGAGDWIQGWVDLSAFRKLYGAAEFEADHGDEFFEADGGIPITREQTVVLWLFPGSGEVWAGMGGPDFWLEEETCSYGRIWTEAEGKDWAEVPYWYGSHGWIYLPDPYATDLPRSAPRYADENGAAPGSGTEAGAVIRPGVAVICAVSSVAAVTAVSLVLLTRKRKNEENKSP